MKGPPPELERALLERNGKREGDELRFRCLFSENHTNGDADPSASYNPKKTVWYCPVCDKGGGWTDLCKLMDIPVSRGRRPKSQRTAFYLYRDEDGTPLRRKVRWEPGLDGRPKSFTWEKPGQGETWTTCKGDGNPEVLYHSEELPAARKAGATVWVVEGEKDADAATALGFVAVTNPEGGGNAEGKTKRKSKSKPRWKPEYSQQLRGLPVVVLPDNDDVGRRHAHEVATALRGVASAVSVVELPDLPSGGDVSDWLEAQRRQGAAEEVIRAELERFVAEAEPWESNGHQHGDPTPDGSVSVDEDGASVEEALEELRALGPEAEPAAVEESLARLAAALEECSPLELQGAREAAIRALEGGKVRAPARFVDAALGAVGRARRSDSPVYQEPGTVTPYAATEHGLVHWKPSPNGEVPVQLTNFTARIVGEVSRDDGVEIQRSFEIAAHHRGQEHRFEVTSREFSTMRWVTEQLGATAIVNAGRGTRDHARAAIQHLSDEVEVRRVYTHLGWRKIDAGWCYLHGGGAIGQVGQVSDIGIDLPPELARFTLPRPPEPDDLRRAVEASLRCLDLLADEVTFPLFGAVYRAPLGAADFSVHVSGETGAGKTELAALAEQHYGSGLDARHLPGSWSSTANALETLAFAAKDALLVVDDFAPEGSRFDIQRLHGEASRLLRAQGNQSGRGRLRPDGTLRPVKTPRGLILSTGEDIPRNHSIRARTWVLEVAKGAMDWELLTLCQKDAASGLYAQAMAGFLRWLAPRYDEIQRSKPRRIAELRSQAVASSGHRRTPTIAAELAFALEQFIGFARESGVLSDEQADALWSRGWAALGQAATNQAGHLDAQDQVARFLDLLRSAISSGRAHVASADGNEPDSPEVWGWRERRIGGGGQHGSEWQPQGEHVGWLRDDDLYLDPDSAYKAVEGMATLDGLSITSRTLWKRMSERGLLATVDSGRETLRVRVTLEGARRAVLHLRSSTLLTQEPAQPAQTRRASPPSGADSRAGSADEDQEPDQSTCPPGLVGVDLPSASGRAAQLPGEDGTEIEEWEEV